MGADRVPDAADIDEAADGLLAAYDDDTPTPLSASQLRALLTLEALPGGVNLRGLAGHLGVVLSSASRLADRLVTAGLLERRQSDADRREVLVRLSPPGRRFLAELRARRRERLATVLARMTPADRAALRRGLEAFREAAG
ncbi:MarR family winged helix-turn-helix transcriptional regulator [Catenuloplanes atrovinosus]|uniref:DNA-binding MarR family transcriptional regulator n=1 Tax=Catenuloplanes atrovinosus TaxID=137266 RepID=A0AAE3YM10_9ACTN|nr:MarR family transcriptional regulator [Catenuloplanes atrovinosus]MDR7274967.1 DNA-binding MarR family transcriptional regulator [Catenuloplanes atrovinosus]